jgi:hypothetical protein
MTPKRKRPPPGVARHWLWAAWWPEPKGYAADRPWGRPADDELAAARAAGGPA